MAKTKIQSNIDALKYYDEIMNRASASGYCYVNKILLGKSKSRSMLIIPDDNLWNELINRNKGELRELDLNNKDDYEKKYIFQFGEDLSSGWIDIDPDIFSRGKIMKVSYKTLEYEVPINKDLLPLKLRKVEWNNISYKIFTTPNLILGLKKRFDFPLEGYGFTLMTMYQIL